jgi:stage II sporulation protein D
MKLPILFSIAFFLISSCGSSGPLISVNLKIFDKRPFVKISSPGGVIIKCAGQKQLKGSIVISISNLICGEIMVAPAGSSEVLCIYSDIPVKKYRGSLTVRVKDGRFHIINMVSEDDYLCSVVGSEMDGRFPAEAKKAQAVVSRSLLYYLLREKKEPSDLPGEFQAYRGSDYESRDAAAAVAQTRGIVLTYKNRIIYPFFHSTCGGTLLPFDIKRGLPGGFYPGIKEAKMDCTDGETNCSGSPYFHWKAELDTADIERAAGIRGVNSMSLITGKNGWVSGVLVVSGRTALFTACSFLDLIHKNTHGAKGPLSYMFTVKKRGSFYEFEGSGFGHHSGMCQWGARGLSLRGKKYPWILAFYYPGCVLLCR